METFYSESGALVITPDTNDNNVYIRVAKRQQDRRMDWNNSCVFTLAASELQKFNRNVQAVKNGESIQPDMFEYVSKKTNNVNQMTIAAKDGLYYLAIKNGDRFNAFQFDSIDLFEYFINYVETLARNWPLIKTITDNITKVLRTSNYQQQTNILNNQPPGTNQTQPNQPVNTPQPTPQKAQGANVVEQLQNFLHTM